MSRVKEIWRYPIKSMAGERLTETGVGERGVTGDRAWVIRDEETSAICGAKSIGGLMRLAAAYTDPPTAEGSSAAAIRFEDGSASNSTDPDVHERLSGALGRRVTLWPLIPPTQRDHYKRAVPIGEMSEGDVRAFFGRKDDEPLPDMSNFPVELMEYESPIGTYFDAFPLLVMTTQSLQSMQERAPDSRFDVRRFRPNLLLDGVDSGDPFPELAWTGWRAAVGGAILQLAIPCPRCVMVTRGFQDLEKDPKVMRALVRETRGDFGIGAIVEQPGTIREGDAFTLLD
jgi:hypothetical protein